MITCLEHRPWSFVPGCRAISNPELGSSCFSNGLFMENVKKEMELKTQEAFTLKSCPVSLTLKNLRLKNEPKGRGNGFSEKSGISVRLKTSVVTRRISLCEQNVTIPWISLWRRDSRPLSNTRTGWVQSLISALFDIKPFSKKSAVWLTNGLLRPRWHVIVLMRQDPPLSVFCCCWHFDKSTKRKQKDYDTWCSQVVSNPSTNQARRGLTSLIRREVVLSSWYGRNIFFFFLCCSIFGLVTRGEWFVWCQTNTQKWHSFSCANPLSPTTSFFLSLHLTLAIVVLWWVCKPNACNQWEQVKWVPSSLHCGDWCL